MTAFLALAFAWLAVITTGGPHTVRTQADQEALARLFTGPAPGAIREALARSDDEVVELPDPARPGARVFAGDSRGRLTNAVCRADLIAVGRLADVTPHLNADESSLYSEWRLDVTQVLKVRRVDASPRDRVTVYLRGGSMRFGDRQVTVANRDFARGLEPGATVLLFASRVPDGEALVASAGFGIEDGILRRTSARSRYPDLEDNALDVGLGVVREVLALTRNNRDCVGRP